MIKTVDTRTSRLWIAGNYNDAVRAVREFCSTEGDCYAVAPVDYVYTGGMEAGVCVTRINYPRFPAGPDDLKQKLMRLGEHLCDRLYQESFSIEGNKTTTWVSHRHDQ